MALGPRRKPTKLKILQGNPGKRPIKKDEIDPKVEAPGPPAHLSKNAKIEWRRIVKILVDLELMSKMDRTALAAYCVAYDRWAEAEKKIQMEGLTIETTNGNIIQNPSVGIANKAMLILHRFLVEFGMTPAARTKVTPANKKKKNEKTDFFD